ncbi:MAG: hypothetical protein COX65_01635 [Elusimicrobia bacterium CG_4_10_14_0_2_um_filter_56_8]|nr:MAG: hypothetical protein COX65_01635 [Elusimicrobia bacterium CG_4_10_14_0_2_um_filter_56_8]
MKTNLVAVALVSLFCAQALPSFAGEAEANYNKMCASCHGKNKKGNPAMAKMFKVKPEAMDLTAIPDDVDAAAIISDGKGKMPSYKATLTAEEIAALSAFFKPAEAKTAETKEPAADAPAEAKPARAAETAPKEAENSDYKACASCHGKNGKGNPAMAKMFKVKPEAMDLTGKVVQGKSDEDLAGVIADGKGKMPSYKATLSGDRIKELVKFLRSLVPQEKP